MPGIVMRKRGALRAGEVGLFIDSEAFESDFAEIRSNVDLQTKVTQPHNLKQFRLAWSLATKIAQSGALGDFDKNETMDYLLKKCKHIKYIQNKHRDGEEIEVVAKSIRWSALEQSAFDRLFRRMIYIITTEILPHMSESTLRDEVEKMAGVSAPEPEQKSPPKRRRPALPAPVSVIPPVDEAGPADAAPPAPKPTRASAPEPAPSASPAAQAGGVGPVEVIPEPTNVQTWKDHCKRWLDAAYADPEMSDVTVLAKWNGEQKLRNRCGITAEDRQGHFAYMTAIVEEKRERQAKKVQP